VTLIRYLHLLAMAFFVGGQGGGFIGSLTIVWLGASVAH
jgi:hypothetical protein